MPQNKQEAATMSIEVIPTGAACGAEIQGVDLAHSLDEASFAAIDHAYAQHGVIFFRNQTITPQQQVAFTRRFGEIAVNIFSGRWTIEDTPEIVIVSNKTKDGKPLGIKRAGENWHSDMCYTPRPPRGTMLYALEIPALNGLPLGDTEFASASAAWDALPASMQAHLQNRKVIFDFTARKRSFPLTQAEIDRYPQVRHPIVRTHPQSGRKCLYVMRDDSIGIEGIETEEAEALIAALADHIVKPAFIYRHQWQAGDVLMWDNCLVQHRAIQDYDLPRQRLMHRTTMDGTIPV
jgi:taurine dioxygenase